CGNPRSRPDTNRSRRRPRVSLRERCPRQRRRMAQLSSHRGGGEMNARMFQTAVAMALLPIVSGAAELSWHREAFPILRANCVSCHKPGKTKGGLDLTTHESLMKGAKHGAVIKPGDAKGSRLIESVCGEEPEMPKEGEPLTAAEVDILTRWINEGAKPDAAV